MPYLDRREFLMLPVVAYLTGCVKPGAELTPRERLIQEVNDLPKTPIKSLLITRVLRYYQGQFPQTFNFADVDIQIWSTRISYDYQRLGDKASGAYTLRESNIVLKHLVASEQTLAFPLVTGVTEDERVRYFPPENRLPDGTPIITRRFLKDREVYPGFAPWITIIRSTNLSPHRREEFAQIERYGFIKEACGLLLTDLFVEESVRKMQQFGLTSSLQITDPSGMRVTVEGVSSLIANVLNGAGRISALTDLGSYLLALKAVEGTSYYRYIAESVETKKILPDIGDMDYGSDGASILQNSFNKVLSTPALNTLAYKGVMSNIP